ncbi:hypothetical protein ACQ4LE_010242 [Meloidogyne hapla]
MNIYLFLRFITFLFLLSFKNSVEAAEGVFVWDIAYGVETFKCLKEFLSTKFIIAQAFNYSGYVDETVKLNIEKAREAGICDIDVYIYPCVRLGYLQNGCGNAKKTIDDTLNYLKNNNLKVGRVWLAIFGLGSRDNVIGWDNYNTTKNIEFIEEMINTLKECKQDYGIYTAKADWFGITGNTQKFKDVPLVYDYELYKAKNFNDFIEFGGWTKPTAKLYSFSTKCAINVANAYKKIVNGCYESEVDVQK